MIGVGIDLIDCFDLGYCGIALDYYTITVIINVAFSL
jgi:hypothetical protein